MQDFYQFDHYTKEKTLIHAISKKEFGEEYAFSLALHTGEAREKIIANRESLAHKLSIGKETVFVVANQIHSDHITVIEKKEMRGWDDLEDAVQGCDALITDQTDVVLTILTADCVPVLLYDPTKRVVAAVHAGWKGTQADIITKTIKIMSDRFGSDPSDILAGVAPSIGQCCYEVGEDVASYFSDHPNAIEQCGEKYMLDLPQINREQMILAGLLDRHIEMSGICTACSVEEYFSYRKEQGCSGRFMSMIGIR